MMQWPFDRKPLLVFWETTKACDLVCKHCRAEATLEPLPGELSTWEAEKLIDDVASFGNPTPIMVFTGGDPLKRRDLWHLLEYASSQGVRTAIAPSVTPLLTRETVERLAKAGVGGASLSLDSPFEEIHDIIRGVPGTWRRTLEALKWFRDAGIRVQVNTVVMRDTVYGLADMVKLLLDLNVRIWEVFYLVPVGRAGFQSDLKPEEWEDVTHFLYEASKYGLTIRTTEGPMFRRVVIARSLSEKLGKPSLFTRGLGTLYTRLTARLRELLGDPPGPPMAHTTGTRDGRGIVFINYKGDVYPSGFLPVPAGNVRVKSLREIYLESGLFRMLRSEDMLEGRCGRCEFARICGGSRAKAFAYHGRVMAEDPQCTYEPGSYARIMEEEGLDPNLLLQALG